MQVLHLELLDFYIVPNPLNFKIEQNNQNEQAEQVEERGDEKAEQEQSQEQSEEPAHQSITP